MDKKIRLELIRLPRNKCTEGVLFFDGVEVMDTLEDVERDFNNDGDLEDEGEEKVYGKTAILRDTYELKVTFSNHFKKMMVLVLNTKYFKGVRFHGGLTVDHTEGCVLVGKRVKEGILKQCNGTQRMIDIVNKCIEEDGYCYVKIR